MDGQLCDRRRGPEEAADWLLRAAVRKLVPEPGKVGAGGRPSAVR